MGVPELRREVHTGYDDVWVRRDVLGVHAQKQEGLSWVGLCVPAGRLQASDMDGLAALAEEYGDGTVRMTVEENMLLPNVPNARLPELLAEPLLQRCVLPRHTAYACWVCATPLVHYALCNIHATCEP